MNEIRIPQKNEIRSRAKILTDEAFRETRNYLDVHKDVKNQQSREFLNNLYKKIAIKTKEKTRDHNPDEIILKTSELRELLNKISQENYDTYCDYLLKYSYDEILLENFRVNFIDCLVKFFQIDLNFYLFLSDLCYLNHLNNRILYLPKL